MARVRFEDGTVINFNGMPSQADIEEAYSSVKGKKSSGAGGSFGSETDISAQVAKGLYEKMPFAKRVLSTPGVLYNPNAEKSMAQVTEPKGLIPTLARKAGEIAPDFVMSAPFFKGASLIPKAGLSIKAGIGAGAYGGAKAIAEGKGPIEGTKQALGGFGAGLGAGLLGVGAVKAIKGTPGAIKSLLNLPNKVLRGGLSSEEAQRITTEYGNSNATLVDKIKTFLGNKISEANTAYKQAIDNFKGNIINSQSFYQTLKKGLVEKGWIDLQGNPTTRFQSGLDPVTDKLTNLFMDLQNAPTNAGKKVLGQLMSKVDFSTYRDALSAMLKDRPSDILVQQARNALYNSAENSGMTGIKVARNLEKQAFQNESKFLNSNTGDLKIATEQKLSRIGTDKNLSKQELDHIKELENYTGVKIIDEAGKINKINVAKAGLIRKKDLLKGAAWGAGLTVLGVKGAKRIAD